MRLVGAVPDCPEFVAGVTATPHPSNNPNAASSAAVRIAKRGRRIDTDALGMATSVRGDSTPLRGVRRCWEAQDYKDVKGLPETGIRRERNALISNSRLVGNPDITHPLVLLPSHRRIPHTALWYIFHHLSSITCPSQPANFPSHHRASTALPPRVHRKITVAPRRARA